VTSYRYNGLADQAGAVTFAQTYDLYGVVTTSAGLSASGYGFTGEYQSGDSVYLRARHYAPSTGRFLSRDTWRGDANRPLSFNRWGYGYGNPVNFVDPTGHIKEGPQAEKADLIVAKLHNIYNVRIRKDWGYRLVSVPVADLPPGVFTGILYYGCEWEEGN
jgi:RHS repeat-associated protein